MGELADQLAHYAGEGGLGFLPDDQEEFERGHKVGRPSEHPEGLSFSAPWEDPFSGFPEHARRLAIAIDRAGMAVHLRSTNPQAQLEAGPERMELKNEMLRLTNASIGQYLADLTMIVPDRNALQNMVTHPYMPPADLAILNRYKIVATVWERQWVSEHFARVLNHVGQVWVSCHDNARLLERSGVEPAKIHVVPMPFFPDDPHLALQHRQRLAGPPRFYHIGKWEPRKAQDRIIGAFLTAFRPGEASFMMKTSERCPRAPGFAETLDECVLAWLENERVKRNGWTLTNVGRYFYRRAQTLPVAELRRLHEVYDCYVSLSRGEGVDMPALDAKLAGRLLLYTPSGGPQDFASPDDVCVPVTGTVPANPFYNWEKGATYYDYDFEAAVAGFRTAHQILTSGQRIAPARLDAWRSEAVGKQALALIEKLRDDARAQNLPGAD